MNRLVLAATISVWAVILAACATEPAFAPATPQEVTAGAELWEHRCRGCHEPGLPGIPVKAELAKKRPGYVVKALTTGKMADIAEGLTAEEIRQIAAFVTQPG